ncbi:MAG: ATP-binding protein [Clostridia bacterium]|nr:ATP-binding protein [Clostridia bacterium]
MSKVSKESKRIIKYLLILLVIATLLQYLVLKEISVVKLENKIQSATIQGQHIASTIQLTIDNVEEASRAVKYFYLDNPDYEEENFDRMARSVMDDHPAIESMYIAPEGIIRSAYPEEVKASTIGFEMLKDPDQGPRAQLAIDTGLATIAGPHNLVEGGVGLILRNPVFVDGAFRGFSVLILDWNDCVNDIMSNIGPSMSDYKFAVWKETKDETAVTDEDGYIFRNSEEPISKKVDIEIDVPNDVWHLTIEPVNGWGIVSDMVPSICISVFISLVISFVFVSLAIFSNRKKMLQIEQAENETKSQYLQQLSAALEKAEKADAAKTAFLSRMSHDIRTPLNGIIGLIQIDEKHADDRELVDRNREKIKVSANHLLELINDVLEIAKMDDENVQLAEEPIDLLDLTNDVFTIIENRAIEEGIKLTHDNYSEKIIYPYVYGSPLHLRQIIINLLSNAIKYNKKNGSINCSVDLVSKTDETVTYRVVVEDTGIGMSKEFLSRLFEPFSQEHSDERSVYFGTGLGMSIVKSLVDKMNGSIYVESEQGVGSKFTVEIPFRLADSDAIPKKAEASDFSFDGTKILLVEDNELNMEIAEAILTDVGAVITKAFNGEEALDIFINTNPNTFDIIITDIMMPKMNGYELTQSIRHMESRPDGRKIPIIAMTANAFEEDRRNALSAGMNGHVAKPIDIAVLMKTLAKIVGK